MSLGKDISWAHYTFKTLHVLAKYCSFVRRLQVICDMKTILATLALISSFVVHAADTTAGGLHTQDWFSVTFKDIAEDISDAATEGKRLALVFEQHGCIYCTKMHEVILADDEVSRYIKENFNIVQINIFGDEEVTDLDGDVLTEKAAAAKWGVMFTPTILFMPEAIASESGADGLSNALKAAVAALPGGFDKYTFLHTFQWVNEKGYEGDEHLQKYHARKFNARKK